MEHSITWTFPLGHSPASFFWLVGAVLPTLSVAGLGWGLFDFHVPRLFVCSEEPVMEPQYPTITPEESPWTMSLYQETLK